MRESIRHVVITGEVGAGKSTALRAALSLLGVPAQGVETYAPEARGVYPRHLHIRPFGGGERGVPFAVVPGGDAQTAAAVFDGEGVRLLQQARESGAPLIAVDECGRLERCAGAYQLALRACLDGDTPMLIALRLHKAEWADFIRSHPRAALIEVTPQNRDAVPEMVCRMLRRAME
ncbi:MAG: hypothetical protein J6K32_02395 [Clostridia bacterium]|nr:hypothetical protein [Clostridia bacterium]